MSGQRCFGIVLRQRTKHDRFLRAHQSAHSFREFQNRDFVRIADINGIVLVGFEQPVDAVEQIGNVAETAGLLAVAIYRQRFAS